MLIMTNLTVGFSFHYPFCASVPAILLALSRATLETITGNMLGDGHVGFSNRDNNGKGTGNARYGMTMSTFAYSYLLQLFNAVYAQ